MKKIIIQLFFFGIVLNSMCQNPDSALIETNGFINTIDGIQVRKENINLEPGIHSAQISGIKIFSLNWDATRSSIVTSYSYNTIGINVFFTVEKGKTYSVKYMLTNVYDTTTRVNYFNHVLPNIIDKATSQNVISLENRLTKFTPFADTCGALHLNFKYDVLDIDQSASIQLSSFGRKSCEAIFIRGWTKDNFQISYTNTSDSSIKKLTNCNLNNLKIYLKPGYYWLGYVYEYNQTIVGSTGIIGYRTAHASNTFNFLVKSGDNTTIDLISNKITPSDNSFKGLHEPNLNSIFFLPDGKYGWIVSDDGIILRTKNGGKTWLFSQNGKGYKGFILDRRKTIRTYLNYRDVSFADSLNGWVVGEGGVIINSNDGGVTWTNQNNNPNIFGTLSYVRFFNERFGFATKSAISYANKLFFTINGGKTWSTLDNEKSSIWKLVDNEKSSAMFYAFSIDNIWKATDSKIFQSTDMCKTWSFSLARKKERTIGDSIVKRKNLIYFIDPLHGWILQDGIQSTKDGGKTWEKQNISVTPDFVFFISKDIGWACTRSGTFFKTINGGKNWLWLKTNNVIQDITKVFFTDENNGWAVGPNGFIYSTTDGGQNWNVLNVLDFI